MMKRFHVDGICYPEEHYMVDMDDRLEEIKKLIEDGKYFVINRARQYGKTTILGMLAGKLSDEYQIFRSALRGWEMRHMKMKEHSAEEHVACSMIQCIMERQGRFRMRFKRSVMR